MNNPSWFDQSHYMSLKLAQMQSTNPSYTMFELEKAIADAGYTPFEHFNAFGAGENLSPNAKFNVSEYLEAKANQLNTAGSTGQWTAATVLSAIEAGGMNPWEHYSKYGSAEGVNPSNSFDEATYISLKLAQLQRDEPDAWTGKTEADVRTAFNNAGMTALEHYNQYGKNEKVVSDESQLVTKNPVTPDPGGKPTVVFTKGLDNVVGSSANEVYMADMETWTLGDSLDGGNGVDTLRLNYTGDIVRGSQTVKNVENLEVTQRTVSDWNGDVTEFNGLEKVTMRGGKDLKLTASVSVTDVNIEGATGAVTVNGDGVTRVSVSNVAGNVTLANAKDHSLNLNLDSVGKNAAASTISDVTASSVSIAATGGASNVDLAINAAKNLTITGTAELTVGNTLTGRALESINATSYTGDITFTDSFGDAIAYAGGSGKDVITVGATTKLILTGKGDDTVNIDASVLGKNGLVNAGEGRDTLGMNFANAVAAGSNFTTQVKGFETLELAGNSVENANLDMSKFVTDNAIDTVVVGASTKAFTISNLADKATVHLNGTMAEAVTLQVKDAGALGHNADALNMILGENGAISNLLGGIVASDLETLNITSQGISTNLAAGSDDNVVDFIKGLSNNATVNIFGGSDLRLTTGEMGAGVSFNAKDFTGNLTLNATSNSKDVAIVGGSGNDVLTGGKGTDAISGGKGNDTFHSSLGRDTFTGGDGEDTYVYGNIGHSTAVGYDTITDFTHNEDTLDLAGVSAVRLSNDDVLKVQNAVKALSSSASINDALDAAANAVNTANGVMWFEFNGKTYVYQESTADQTAYKAGDLVIELAGTNLGLTADDINFS